VAQRGVKAVLLMSTKDKWLVHEHSIIEGLLFECEDAIGREDWKAANRKFMELIDDLKLHMALEEEVLFPAYEASGDAPQGPTAALRREHDEIVRLVEDMVQVIRTRDSAHVLDSLIALEKVMIKHHEKEEDIFLPMASRLLLPQRDELLKKLNAFSGTASGRRWKV
jgi:hemerythrin-like domain-containing protein